MALNEEIRVSHVELRKYASEMERIQKAYVTLISQAEDETKKLRALWTGEAAEQYVASFTKVKASCSEYIEMMKTTILSLNETADSYESGIHQVMEAADSLPKLSGNTMR